MLTHQFVNLKDKISILTPLEGFQPLISSYQILLKPCHDVSDSLWSHHPAYSGHAIYSLNIK